MIRREFNRAVSGVLLSGTTIDSFGNPADSFVGSGSNQLCDLSCHLIYDKKFQAPAKEHADAMRNKPNLHRFDGEFNVLWYETVLAICERPDVEIFGITRHSEFFIISSLSAGYGYRTVRSTSYSDYVVWHLTTATRFDTTV